MYLDLANLNSVVTNPLVMAGAILVAGFVLARLTLRYKPAGEFACRLISFVGFSVMLSVAHVVPFKPTPETGLTVLFVAVGLFKIIWWLAAAWLCAGLIRAVLMFKRRAVETRFLQDLFAGFIYTGSVLCIVAYVFDIPVSGVLAASGVIAIVLGLALQSTLGDVFSGIVLNFAKPFHVGDWLVLNGGLQGRVVEANWRATHVLTLAEDLAIIPNSVIAKAELINASKPTSAHGLTLTVRLDPMVAPALCVGVLERAMLGCDHILRLPPPTVTIRQLDASALQCELAFAVPSIEQSSRGSNEVFDRVFRHCASARIRLAPPNGGGFALQPLTGPPNPGDVPRLLLERLPVFAPLSTEERLALAPKMKRHAFKTGEILIERNTVAKALFVLHAGVLAASQKQGDLDIELFRLSPGDCFAEASMLTGAPTMFTVKALTSGAVYEIGQADLAPLMKARPAIAAELSQTMANRQAAGLVRLAELDGSEGHEANLADRITDRIKLVFGL